jgi:hypothetical protein
MANPTGTIRVRVSFRRSFSWLQTWLQVREAAKSRSHLEVPELFLLFLLWGISMTREACSPTTVSVLPRPARRYQLFSAVSRLPSLTDLHSQRTLAWAACKLMIFIHRALFSPPSRQERITTTKKGFITSVQTVYVPARSCPGHHLRPLGCYHCVVVALHC